MEYSEKTIRSFLEEKGVNNVTDEAVEHLGETIELFAGYITEEAVGKASENKKTVVNKDDIKEALE